MCNVSPGSHVWTRGSQLLELFGKAVEPLGGGPLVEKVGHWVGLEVLGLQFLGHFVPPVCWCSVMNWSSALVPCFLHCGGYHPPGAGDHNKPFLLKLLLSWNLTTTRRKIRLSGKVIFRPTWFHSWNLLKNTAKFRRKKTFPHSFLDASAADTEP